MSKRQSKRSTEKSAKAEEEEEEANDKRRKQDHAKPVEEQSPSNDDCTSSASFESKYTIGQRVKIVQTYYRKKENIENALNELSEHFFDSELKPTKETILHYVKKFEETGSL